MKPELRRGVTFRQRFAELAYVDGAALTAKVRVERRPT
jgi:hypothetical protein